MDAELLSALISWLRRFSYFLFFAAGMLVGVVTGNSDALQQLLNWTSDNVRQVKVGAVEISLNEKTISQVSDLHFMDAVRKAKLSRVVNELTPDEFVRLIDVMDYKNTCIYDQGEPDMLKDAYTDRVLEQKKLVERRFDPQLTDQLTKLAQSQEAKTKKPPANGYPRDCYVLTPTEHGGHVKTAIVQIFKTAFEGH